MIAPGGEVVEEPLYYLPMDERIRRAVEADALISTSHEVYERLRQWEGWPRRMISRLIGVNTLVLFIAAYSILNITKSESALGVADIEKLVYALIERFESA